MTGNTGDELIAFPRGWWRRWPERAFGFPAGSAADRVWVRWSFLRILGLIFIVAFTSFWLQLEGLIGDRGILPAGEYLGLVENHYGAEAYRLLPTLAWFSPGDGMSHALCFFGTLAGLLLLLNRLPGAAILVCWLCYLSVCAIGQVFMGYQWDNLLLEVGFLAMFVAPWTWNPGLARTRPPGVLGVWLFLWLLFRLMFASGAVKLLSDDEAWWGLTALNVHYETQPLPTWIGWYAHQLPEWFQKFSVLAMFSIELVVPFLMFIPGKCRLGSFFALVFLQLAILTTGNYTFFNWLTLVLCLWLLRDKQLAAVLPARFKRIDENATGEEVPEPGPADEGKGRSLRRPGFWVLAFAALTMTVTGGLLLYGQLRPASPLPPGGETLLTWVGPFRTVNRYGLFAVMTTSRPEIVVEGSMDGETWKAYELRWKPGDPTGRPRFVAPHQPRLDWQMWFAALGSYRRNVWLMRFLDRLIEGEPAVTGLLAHNPFADAPPRMVRALVYDYRFTDWETRSRTGRWWTRELKGLYAPVVQAR